MKKKGKKNNDKKHGICKLTGRVGFYVDSHIIPLSLTRLSTSGEKVVEAEIGSLQRLRFQGWYDNELVIRAGEDVLANLDSNAIIELRKHRLVWHSFEDDHQFMDLQSSGEKTRFRLIDLGEAEDLRLFFLSLLWRVAASSRPEFAEIKLAPSVVTALRSKILASDPGQLSDFPVQLFQIVTKGTRHNRSPVLESKNVVDETGASYGDIQYVRFYLDGLIAHIHVAHNHPFPTSYLSTVLGHVPTVVFAHKFEDSRTHENILELVRSQ